MYGDCLQVEVQVGSREMFRMGLFALWNVDKVIFFDRQLYMSWRHAVYDEGTTVSILVLLL